MRKFEIGKLNTFLVNIMMMAVLLCFGTRVQAAQDVDFTHSVTNNEAQITGYTGIGGNSTIPNTLCRFPAIFLEGLNNHE